MELLNVVVAGIAAYAFGAIWYMSLAKHWMEAAEIEADENGRPANNAGIMPFVLAFVGAIVVAGMMRHVFAQMGIDSLGKGLVSGLGIGLFMASPWIVINYAFAGRKRNLTFIDCGFASISCAIIGLILALF